MSLSKWEEIWCKPFLNTELLTKEDIMSYAECMTITHNVKPYVYKAMTRENINRIEAYIEDPHSATKLNFSSTKKGGIKNQRVTTAEWIYYYMFRLKIPIECSKWHLNKLLILINIFVMENEPPKRVSKKELALQYADINEKRKAQLRKEKEAMKG